MAVAVLSPWPAATAAAALAKARALLDRELGGTGDDFADVPAPAADEAAAVTDRRARRDLIDRLGGTAAAMIEAHAPGAPQPVRNEAAVRVAGWLKGARRDDLVSMSVGGSVVMQYRHNPGRNALRLSGAAGLLQPWRKPAAAILEESA